MAWIESHQGILNHPKTLDLMQILDWDVDVVISKLHRLWWWCVDYAEDGDLRKHNDDRIARAVALNGGVEAKRFVDGMVKAGWLDREPYFRVHDWWDYVGKFMQGKYSRSPEKWMRIKELYKPNINHKVAVRLPSLTKPNLPNQTKPKEKTKERAGKFVPPTPPEVSEFARSIGFPLDGEKFCAFYGSKGWVVGRSPMRDWRAAVRTWKGRWQDNPARGGLNGKPDNGFRSHGNSSGVVGKGNEIIL